MTHWSTCRMILPGLWCLKDILAITRRSKAHGHDKICALQVLELSCRADLDDHLVAGHHHVEAPRDHQLLALVRLPGRSQPRTVGARSARTTQRAARLMDLLAGLPTQAGCTAAARPLRAPGQGRARAQECLGLGGDGARARSSWLPWNLTGRTMGHHLRNSFIQLWSVDLGTMTMCGPVMPRYSFR